MLQNNFSLRQSDLFTFAMHYNAAMFEISRRTGEPFLNIGVVCGECWKVAPDVFDFVISFKVKCLYY